MDGARARARGGSEARVFLRDETSASEAEQRRARFGPNALESAPTVSALRILLDQFRGVVVLLLLGAATLAALLRDPVEAGAILGVLVINAALGFATELRARSAMARGRGRDQDGTEVSV